MPLIFVKDLCKTYESEDVKTSVLHDVSFSVEKGEFLAIMGPSGSGKSTLMHILGLLERASCGEYLLDGRNVTELTDTELAVLRNKRIGFVFQAFNLLPKTTVEENVELPLLYDSDKRERNGRRIAAALEAVDMTHRAKYFSNQLSGGEKQRVAIARALVNDPDIVFADEPTGNLDSKSGLQVMRILQSLNDAGRTVILVTHETVTAEHAKRIIRVVDGRIVADEQVAVRRIAGNGEVTLK
ncbi:MAG: ABC transporter ATP-binding protein [Candidatus Moranbacteria bacterium]|nr:ABC transporter ATP-binding protein [Candidatus Moranbacteria bacterium]NTW75515.1 ABC transporter ATP-binding protein [Candidatus Moranbacteria bacterium]